MRAPQSAAWLRWRLPWRADGPLTRPELAERLDAAGVRTEGQALIAVLALACLRGIAVPAVRCEAGAMPTRSSPTITRSPTQPAILAFLVCQRESHAIR